MKRSLLWGAILVVVAGSLTGCSAPGHRITDDSLDVYGAKDIAQRMERALSAFVPKEATSSVEQIDSGVLLSCEGDRSFRWTGHLYMDLVTDIDTEPLVDEVAAHYSQEPGFWTERDTTRDGVPRVRVRGPHGSSYSMALSVDRTRIEILSFSPCFHLADGLHPRDTY